MRTAGGSDLVWGSRLGMSVSVHVDATTVGRVRVYRTERRVTVTLVGNDHAGDVTLFLPAVELRALRDLLTDALTSVSDADTATDSSADNPVCDPADDPMTRVGVEHSAA